MAGRLSEEMDALLEAGKLYLRNPERGVFHCRKGFLSVALLIVDDELLEPTPEGWRLRKRYLSADERVKERKKSQMQAVGRG